MDDLAFCLWQQIEKGENIGKLITSSKNWRSCTKRATKLLDWPLKPSCPEEQRPVITWPGWLRICTNTRVSVHLSELGFPPSGQKKACQSSCLAMVKWLIRSVLLSGLWWDSGYRLRSKSRFSPPSPIIQTPLSLLHCWLPVCPFVLLFPPFTAGPISGRMKQTDLRNPGLRCSCFDVSLTDGTFCFWAPCWALPPWTVHQGGLRSCMRGLALKWGR